MKEKNKKTFLAVLYSSKIPQNPNEITKDFIEKVFCNSCQKYIPYNKTEGNYLAEKLKKYFTVMYKESYGQIKENYLNDYKEIYKRIYTNGNIVENENHSFSCKTCGTNHLAFSHYDRDSFVCEHNDLYFVNNENNIQVITYHKYYQLQISDRDELKDYEDIHYKKIKVEDKSYRIYSHHFKYIDERIKKAEENNMYDMLRYRRLITKSNLKRILTFSKKTKQITLQMGAKRINLSYNLVYSYSHLPLQIYYFFYKELLKEYNIVFSDKQLFDALENLVLGHKTNDTEFLVKSIRRITNPEYRNIDAGIDLRYTPKHLRRKLLDVNSNYQGLKILCPGIKKNMMKYHTIFNTVNKNDLTYSICIETDFVDDFDTEADYRRSINLIQFIIYSLNNKDVVSNFLKILHDSNQKAILNSSQRKLKKLKETIYYYFPRFEQMIYQFTKTYKNETNFSLIYNALKDIAEFVYIIIKTDKVYKNFLINIENYSDETISNVQDKMKFILDNKDKLNYHKLHDNLTLLNFYLVNDLYVYEYNDKEQLYKEKINDIEFCLPENNYRLHDIGSKMNHCVGTYDTLVKNKRALIIYLKKNDKYVLCLEIRNKKIIQAKKKYNDILNDKESEDILIKKTLLTYLEKHNISTNICRDL